MSQDSIGRDNTQLRGPKPKKMVETTVKGIPIGRDKTIVPPEEVEKLAAIGCKNHEIADWFGVNLNTLKYNFSSQLLKGRTNMKMTLRRTMFNNAVHENNTTMQIWLSKNILAMSDNPLDGDANAPLPWTHDDTDDTNIEDFDEDELYEEENDGQED